MGSCLCPCCCPKGSIAPRRPASDANQNRPATSPEGKIQKISVVHDEKQRKFSHEDYLDFDHEMEIVQENPNKAREIEKDRVEENPRRSQEKKVNFEKDKSPGSPHAHNSSGKSSKSRLPALKGSSSKFEKKSG